MALTENRTLTGHVFGRAWSAPIADGATLYDGALASFDANGNLVPADGALPFAGLCTRGGTGVADGSIEGVFERRGTRWLPDSGTPTMADKGTLAKVVDDELVDPGGAGVVIAGKVIDVDTVNNLVLVDLEDRVADA